MAPTLAPIRVSYEYRIRSYKRGANAQLGISPAAQTRKAGATLRPLRRSYGTSDLHACSVRLVTFQTGASSGADSATRSPLERAAVPQVRRKRTGREAAVWQGRKAQAGHALQTDAPHPSG
jgi:hypothetical protein